MRLTTLIRYGVYPVVMTSTFGAVGLVLYGTLPAWPMLTGRSWRSSAPSATARTRPSD